MTLPYKILSCEMVDQTGITHYYIIQAATPEDYDWLVAETIKDCNEDQYAG